MYKIKDLKGMVRKYYMRPPLFVLIKYYFDNFFYKKEKWVFNFKVNNMNSKDDNSSNADEYN